MRWPEPLILTATAVLLLFYSCSPVKTVVETHSFQLPSDTDTVYVAMPVTIPSASSDTITLNLLSLCDSINQGLLKELNKKGNRMSSGHLVPGVIIDSLGIANIFCNQEKYELIIDSMKQLLVNKTTVNERITTRTIQPPFYNLFKYGFIISLLILSLFIYLTTRKK